MVTMFDSTLKGPVLYPEQINCSWEGNPLLKYSSSPGNKCGYQRVIIIAMETRICDPSNKLVGSTYLTLNTLTSVCKFSQCCPFPSFCYSFYKANRSLMMTTLNMCVLNFNSLLAASKSQIFSVPDWDPAITRSSPLLNWTYSTGLVWPDRVCMN